jgi:hypothetical protein
MGISNTCYVIWSPDGICETESLQIPGQIFGTRIKYDVIMATGYQRIQLDRPLRLNDNATDTDRDGIPDWQEISILVPERDCQMI